MKHTSFDDSEIFTEFMRIAERDGLLKKKAELIYPDYDISAGHPELDLGIEVFADKRTDLYSITKETGEQMIGQAHPGGGNKLDLPGEKDLGKVETIVEQHKKNEEIARKMPTGKVAKLVEGLVVLADVLDGDGLTTMAAEIDGQIQKIASELGFTEPAYSLSASAAGLESEGPYSEERRYESGWNRKLINESTPNHTDVGFNDINLPLEPLSPDGEKGHFDSKVSLIAGHTKLQQMLGVPTTGKFDATTQAALAQLGIKPGMYHNWNDLFAMVSKAKAQNKNQNPWSPSSNQVVRREEDGWKSPTQPGQFVSHLPR